MASHGVRSSAGPVGIILVAWLAVVAALWPAHGKTLSWDEADYASAAKLGIVANALEHGSLSPTDFVAFALAKRSGAPPSLPPSYDEATDPFVLRHLHPPFTVYLVSAIAGDQRPVDERLLRAPQLLGALALISALVIAYRSLSTRPRVLSYVLVALGSAWLSVLLFAILTPHGWSAVWTVVATVRLVLWLRSGTARDAALLGVPLGGAVLTLETGPVIWVVVALAFVGRRRLVGAARGSWRQLGIAFAIAVAVVVLAWPGSVLSISLLKTPAFLAYRILLGQEYEGTERNVLAAGIVLLPALVLVPAACLVLWRRGGPSADWRVHLVGAVAYAAAFSRFAIMPEYLGSAVAVALPIVGLAVEGLSVSGVAVFAAAGVLAAAATSPRWWPDPSDPARADIVRLSGELRGRSALVEGAHIVRYYLGPGYDLRPVTQSAGLVSLLARRDGEYVELGRSDVVGKVVVLRIRQQAPSRIERELLARCAVTEQATMRLYDCAAAAR